MSISSATTFSIRRLSAVGDPSSPTPSSSSKTGVMSAGWGIEKMSKSMYNVVNPDYIVDKYGADTLRMYEMFLGPLEQSKPWGYQRHRRRAQIPAPPLVEVLFARGRADRKRRGAYARRVEDPPQDHKEGKGGYRELLVQHIGRGFHDMSQRGWATAPSVLCWSRLRHSSHPSRPTWPRSCGTCWVTIRPSATRLIPSATSRIL